MQEQVIKNLIRNWRQKSHQEGDPFVSFVFIWFCFNAWMEYVSTKETDADMIKELSERSPNMDTLTKAYDKVFDSNDINFRGSIRMLVGSSQEVPIRDTRGKRAPISIEHENDFQNIVRAIYRIRCNLFHGGKDANDQRDQMLVGHAALVLRQWMGRLIATWD